MNILLLSSLLACLWSSGIALHQTAELAAVVDKFNEYKIPEDLGIDFQPQVQLQVIFPQPNKTFVTVTAGQQLERNETALTPAYKTIGGAAIDGPFVILMVDPDAPTPQNRSFSLVLSNTTEAISPYHGTRPIRSSGPHRYIFLMYTQPPDFNSQTVVTTTTSRFYFNLSSFTSETGLGQPIGGNFMLVGPDASSPISITPPAPTSN